MYRLSIISNCMVIVERMPSIMSLSLAPEFQVLRYDSVCRIYSLPRAD